MKAWALIKFRGENQGRQRREKRKLGVEPVLLCYFFTHLKSGTVAYTQTDKAILYSLNSNPKTGRATQKAKSPPILHKVLS